MENIDQILGDDLVAALRELGGDIESAEEITRLRSPDTARASFRLSMKDGRTLKGRRFRSAEHRKSVTDLMPLLRGLPMSRLIAARGAATIEDWIVGAPLQAALMNEDNIRYVATVMGRLHALNGFQHGSLAKAHDTAWYLERLKKQLEWLVRQDGMDLKIGTQLFNAALNNKPLKLEVGLIHTDIHPRNMIMAEGGEIWIVDNEGLRLGAVDYDIARSWRQWPMSPRQRDVFSSAYGQLRAMDAFLEHQEFWAICTLVVTARIHGRHGRPVQGFLENLQHIALGSGEFLWPRLS